MFNQLDSFIGFENNNEYLPNLFDKFDSKQKLRQLFLHMSNIILKGTYFNKYEQNYLSKYSLKQAFEYKIKKDLNQIFVKRKKENSKVFNFCKSSTLVINSYLKQSKKDFYFPKNCKLKIASFINTCYINGNFKLIMDKDLVFHEFVLKKIKKLHIDKEVIDLGNAICIKDDNFHGVKIFTSWKDIKVDKPDIKNELESAVKSIKKGDFYQVYLAYPKNDTFTKQIPIYVDELQNHEYQIKAIPYSLRSIIKTNRS